MEEASARSVERGPLTVRVQREVVTVRIELDGELDMSSSEALELELRRAAPSDAGRIIVDLSGLNYIDSTGSERWRGSRATSGRALPPAARAGARTEGARAGGLDEALGSTSERPARPRLDRREPRRRSAISPPPTIAALRPARWTIPRSTPGLVRPWRWAQGSQSSTPRHSTPPTRNRRPTSALTSIPRVATFRRDSAAESTIPCSAVNASSASDAINVRSCSRFGSGSPSAR